ncbi:DNA polymerase III subunit delta' [Rhizobium sp. G21]|uniref:DNA polymerase III subunit delta' n=1 Tax=Rhizobium sp. G21 TaxID=2758439 RepID=UPI00160075C7|nr:DNA polymerase III subunit delta' [Rhizobium sp. G21]MBB1247671.1 DNA polymerase III subunit delta' [Rhizobium sp. G21]
MSAAPSTLLDGAIAPQENTRLFGHAEAQIFLAESYASGKGHHALLLEGPEGVGKATLAFRFANHILAHPDPLAAPTQMSDPDPGHPMFRQIAQGASHNLLHLTRPVDAKTGKAKTAITVDEVRRAGKFFSQTSGTGNWRIVIVDPADDLNRSAANAILKMLEEPPKRSMFLVLSHAPGKLLPTIRSRCLAVSLRPLGDDDLVSALAHLGLSAPEHVRDRLLALAGGSVSQAIKLSNYGGLDVLDAMRAALGQEGPARRRAIHKIADVVAQKDGDILYEFFIDQLGMEVSGRARAAALQGDVARAFDLSQLKATMDEQIGASDAYNLDRKQTVITLMGEIAGRL